MAFTKGPNPWPVNSSMPALASLELLTQPEIRLVPDYWLDASEERHPEGAYYLEWYDGSGEFAGLSAKMPQPPPHAVISRNRSWRFNRESNSSYTFFLCLSAATC